MLSLIACERKVFHLLEAVERKMHRTEDEKHRVLPRIERALAKPRFAARERAHREAPPVADRSQLLRDGVRKSKRLQCGHGAGAGSVRKGCGYQINFSVILFLPRICMGEHSFSSTRSAFIGVNRWRKQTICRLRTNADLSGKTQRVRSGKRLPNSKSSKFAAE